MYTHMFVQDISAGFVRLRIERERKAQTIDVTGDDTAKATLEGICASISDGPDYLLVDTVWSALESIVTRLAWLGEAIYEICGRGNNLSLASITPEHLVRVPGIFIQLIPRADREWLDGRRYTLLPARRAWVVRLPGAILSSRAHLRLLDELAAVSEPAPDFWLQELKAGELKTGFPVSDYARRRDAYIARITRRWGWNRRDSSGTHDTEFFYFYRSLRFCRAQALLRDHVIQEINNLMARLRVNARIQLRGFRSPAEIDELVRRAVDGSLHYAKALEQAR